MSKKEDSDRTLNLPWPAARSRPRQDEPGHVGFDDRGNAVFQWHDSDLALEGEEADRSRRKALSNPTFSLVDDDPKPNAPIRENPKGLRVGYNPYESGMLSSKQPKKKRDLRALSAWIEQRKKISTKDDE